MISWMPNRGDLVRVIGCVLVATLGAPAVFAQDPRVSKTYDVRFLLDEERRLRASEQWLPDDSTARSEAMDDPVPCIDGETLLALMREMLGSSDGPGSAGVKLEVTNGILFATGTADAHVKVASWIEMSRQLFVEPVTYEMHLVPAKVSVGARGVLVSDEVDALLRAAGPHPTCLSVGRVGARHLLRTNESVAYVRDYDVEVAMGASIPDPKIDVLVAGRTWEVSSSRCFDGRLEIEVHGQQTESSETPRTLQIRNRDMRGRSETEMLQLPAIRYVRESCRARLGDGEGMLFGGDDGASGMCLLRLRRPSAIPLPSGGQWSWFSVGDLVCSRLAASGAHLCLRVPNDAVPLFAAMESEPRARTFDEGSLLEKLHGILPPGGDAVTMLPGALWVVRGDEDQRKAVADMLAGVSSMFLKQPSVEVRFGRLTAPDAGLVASGTLDSGELAGKLGSTFLSPCVLSDSFSRLAGVQRAYLRDYEVEIAQEAGFPNPVVGSVFAGISFVGRVQAATRGHYRLSMDLSFAELAGDVSEFDMKDERFGPVELPRLRDVTFSVAPIVDPNKWTLIYMAPLQGTNDSFAVVARVRD